LADLTAHETLCNNINQFKTVLEKHEPKIQVPSFGLKAISEDSKNAFIETINDCLEALLALNMQSELEKIIAKYEPTAKKIKEAEEKAQQAALEASKRRPATPAPMRTTVRYGEEQGYMNSVAFKKNLLLLMLRTALHHMAKFQGILRKRKKFNLVDPENHRKVLKILQQKKKCQWVLPAKKKM
jgi:hypothetical protein